MAANNKTSTSTVHVTSYKFKTKTYTCDDEFVTLWFLPATKGESDSLDSPFSFDAKGVVSITQTQPGKTAKPGL